MKAFPSRRKTVDPAGAAGFLEFSEFLQTFRLRNLWNIYVQNVIDAQKTEKSMKLMLQCAPVRWETGREIGQEILEIPFQSLTEPYIVIKCFCRNSF